MISTSTKTPTYKICIDDVELDTVANIVDMDNNKKLVEYREPIDEFKKITIEFLNKTPGDTKVVDDKIVEDLLMIVDKLAVDNINLINMLSKISVYKDNDGIIHRTYNYITFPGTMTIKIHKNVLYTMWATNFLI